MRRDLLLRIPWPLGNRQPKPSAATAAAEERATIPLKADQQAGRRRRGTRGRLPVFDGDSYRQRNVASEP